MTPHPFMLDVERRVRRDMKSLAGDLDCEGAPHLQRVCKPTQLRNELGTRISTGYIAVLTGHDQIERNGLRG